MRWHLVLSQNFLLPRYSKLAVVQGTFDLSRVAVILPRLVSMVIVAVPVFGAVAGGVPTSLTLPPPVSGVQVQAVKPAGTAAALELALGLFFLSSFIAFTSHTAAPAMTTTAIAVPMIACR